MFVKHIIGLKTEVIGLNEVACDVLNVRWSDLFTFYESVNSSCVIFY